MKLLLILYYFFLFILRTHEFYLDYLLPLYCVWTAAMFVSLWIKEPTLLLVSSLNLAFLENAAVFDYAVSIPFFVIGTCFLLIHHRDVRALNLIFCVSTFILVSFYPINFVKDFFVFTFIILLSSVSGRTFHKYFYYKFFNYKYIKLVSILIFIFWSLEYLLVFTLPHLRYSIAYSFDFRPLGFFTETTWFTSLLAFLFLAKLMPSRLYSLGMFVPILSLSRAYLLTVIFYVRMKGILLLLPLILVALWFIDIDIFSRLSDFSDVSRFQRLSDIELTALPNMSVDNKATGIFLLQLISIYGIVLACIYLLIFFYGSFSTRNWLPLVFIIVSFVHPIQFSVVFLLSLTIPPLIKYFNAASNDI